ncbi:MAG: type II secretion system F family protein [Candidatus Norongarragalinales archaeon]
MVSQEKLRKMREIVESRGERERAADAGNEPPDSRVFDVEQTVRRIRAREKKAPALFLPPSTSSDAAQRKLDFSRPLLETRGVVKHFYSSFKRPLSGLALFLSRTPFASGLALMLECAGYSFSVETFLVIAAIVVAVASLAAFAALLALAVVFSDPLFGAIAPLVALFVAILFTVLPFAFLSLRAKARAKAIDRVLPFALMQVATQVRAGVSFHHSIESVANADYGVLSAEFKKLVRDLQQGLSTEDALTRLYNRSKSQSLRKALLQVIRSFKTGGNLSKIINDIAQDVAFETHMSIRDFTEKLNFINVIFIMIAVVAPVSATVLSAILQIPLFSSGLPPYFIYLSFGGITAGMIALLYVTKQIEPAVW